DDGHLGAHLPQHAGDVGDERPSTHRQQRLVPAHAATVAPGEDETGDGQRTPIGPRRVWDGSCGCGRWGRGRGGPWLAGRNGHGVITSLPTAHLQLKYKIVTGSGPGGAAWSCAPPRRPDR